MSTESRGLAAGHPSVASARLSRLALVLVLAWAQAGVLPAASTLSDVGLAQLGRENWTREVGLAGDWVRDIVRGTDGFLWVATSGGLSRFDGRSFVNFTAASAPELPGNSIAALAAGPGGRLWVGLEHGGVRVVERGRLRREPGLDLLPVSPVRTLLETPDGALWIGTETGLWRWDRNRLEGVAPFAAASHASLRRLLATPGGELWARTVDRGLWRIRGGEARAEPDAPGCVGVDLALGEGGRLVTSCVGGIWERVPGAAGWTRLEPDTAMSSLHLARNGDLWFGDPRGLARRTSRGTELLATEVGLGDHRVRAYLEEGGDLWIGTFSTGLWRLRRGAVAAIGAPEGLPALGTTAVLGRADGTIWVGTFESGAYLWSREHGIALHATAARGLPSDKVWAIAEDPARPGRVWFGTARGLAELEGGRYRQLELAPGREEEVISLLLPDPSSPGTLWACASGGGIHELRAGRFHAYHNAGNGLAAGRVRALGRERAGTLLAGGDRGLFRYDGRRWTSVPFGGETPRVVRAWAEGEDGALWVASESAGLLRIQGGRIARLNERDGLPFAGIYSLAFDRAGGLWLSGDDGLVRLRVEDVERWTRGELGSVAFDSLTARDGLRVRECNGWGRPAVSTLADGTLIYPTITGIALLDATALETPELSPLEIYVDRAWTGDRELDPGRSLELAAGDRHLGLRFGALEFLRPESVAFRYRLEGAHADWLAAGRRTEAVYSHLKPGRYRFEVQARLPGQDWVGMAQPILVAVAPRLVERPGFRIAAVALLLAGALVANRWRTRVERAHAQAIAHERAFFREVIDTSPNPIFVKSRDSTYTLANRAAAATFGLAPAELVGRADAEVAARLQGAEPVLALDREVLASGEERGLPETRIVDAAGVARWFRVVERPLRDEAGAVRQVIGTAVDVTDFKVSEERLRARERELHASQEELRRLASQLIRAREEERRRLGREIHDDLTQRLAGLNLLAVSLARSARKLGPDAVEAKLGEIGAELARLASDAQALARELHPSLLENLGLEEALRSECETFAQRTGLEIGFESRDVPELLPREVSLVLYRIAQEALRNAVTHSGAARVRVDLEGGDGDLLLTVEDEGRGFASTEPASSGGIGLISMAERSRLVGAEFSVESRPGSGTRVAVRVRRVPIERGLA